MKILTFLVVISAIILTNCTPSRVSNSADPNLSPMETMKALNDAAKTKDTAKIKNLISKGTLDLIEKSAREQNTTVDELLQEDGGAPFQELPEMRNEKIAGETATVEIHNTETGEWQSLPFVKENGAWKAALDRFAEDLSKTAQNTQNSNAAVNDSGNRSDGDAKAANVKK